MTNVHDAISLLGYKEPISKGLIANAFILVLMILGPMLWVVWVFHYLIGGMFPLDRGGRQESPPELETFSGPFLAFPDRK